MNHFRANDGAEIAFFESGAGSPALLFVHGWQADHTVWDDVIEALGPNVHTVAVDLRGSGGSRGSGGPYRLERFAADLRDLIAARGLGPVIAIGHSMGGTVALRFAVDAPELTRGIVLIAPVPPSGGGYSEKGEAYLRATAGDREAARAWLARTFSSVPADATLERLCLAAASTQRSVALESFESWAHADFAEEVRRITAPALVIAPEQDTPEVYERKVAEILRNGRFLRLPQCAHYAILEKPNEIAHAVRDLVQ